MRRFVSPWGMGSGMIEHNYCNKSQIANPIKIKLKHKLQNLYTYKGHLKSFHPFKEKHN